jgi:hypothetical protein
LNVDASLRNRTQTRHTSWPSWIQVNEKKYNKKIDVPNPQPSKTPKILRGQRKPADVDNTYLTKTTGNLVADSHTKLRLLSPYIKCPKTPITLSQIICI